MTPVVDAWAVADPCGCPVCGRETCEDVTHLPPDAPATGRDHDAESAEARDARRHTRLAEEIDRQRIVREARRHLDAEDRGPIVEPQIVTLAQFAAEPEPAVTWRIHGWQPAETRVILAAPRKAGKSTLIGSLVRALVDGDAWLDAARVTPIDGTVALIDTEMSRSQLRRWLSAQRIVAADRVVIVPLRGRAATLDLVAADCRARWAGWLRARRVQYLITDCLRPVLDALALDESREAGRWLVGLDALLLEAGIPEACVVHHMGHTGERSRGDSRLRDWPDVEWRVMRQDEGDASPRYIAAYGRDVDVPEAQLAYDAVTRRLTIAGGSRTHVRSTRALEAIVEVLRAATKPLTGRGIKDALADSDHSRDTIDAALRAGARSGRLTVAEGPRRSRIYRVSECPGVSGQCPADSAAESVSECPSASIEADTPDTPRLPLAAKKTSVSDPDTRRRSAAARNTSRTRRRAAEGTA